MSDDISLMVGKTMVSVSPSKKGDERMVFVSEDGYTFCFEHYQDCCENVEIEDICGDVDDLIGAPILQAEEVVSSNGDPRPYEYCDSWTWTFYKFSTIKGSVTVRWLGESNGYYSEHVDLKIYAPTSGNVNA